MFNIKGVILGLLMLISFSSCKEYRYVVAEDVQPYVEEYLDVLKSNGIKYKNQDIYVVFDNLMNYTAFAGYAHGMFEKDYVRVSIHKSYWYSLSDRQKKILIFHELSHDLFDSLHTWDVFIMQPKMHSRFAAEYVNWDQAINELVKYIKDGR